MNLATLRSQARLKSGVKAGDYSNADLDTQLNEAYYQLVKHLANLDADYFEEQNVLFTLNLNSGLYSLPTDFIRMKQVRLAYSTPSDAGDYRVARFHDPVTTRDVNVDEENASTLNPIVDITNNYFRVKPTPTAAVTDGGKLFYIARPSALTNTADTPIIPTDYHDSIAVYGAREMAGRYDKDKKWVKLNKLWEDTTNALKEEAADRAEDESARMRSPMEEPNAQQVRELY